jgi:SAM-dependent methyltransferase
MLLRQRVFTSFGCCSKENLGIRRLSFRLIELIGAAKMKTLRYSSGYYDSLYDDSARSARRVVPLLVKMFSPRTVIDVGCGSGTWARSFKHAGCQVTGVDGEHVKRERLLITEQEFRRHDLNRPFKSDQRFDLAVSLEVAEHLPAERAGTFVEDLCRLSSIVVFSAAIPGQGGTHHINEQWPSYWVEHFRKNNFVASDCIRPQIWDDQEVVWWYRQNMFVFIEEDQRAAYAALIDSFRGSFPKDIVHPQAYVTATVPNEMSPRMLKEVVRALPHFPGKILRHLRKHPIPRDAKQS